MYAPNWFQRHLSLCTCVFTPRQATLLTGILQTIINALASVLLFLTLKITTNVREMQLTDFIDHGADRDRLIITPEDLPDTNDMKRLWDAKVSNDVKIHAIYLMIVFGLVNLGAYIVLTYSTIVKSSRGLFNALIVICFNVFIFFITSLVHIMTKASYHVTITGSGVAVQTRDIIPSTDYDVTVPWIFIFVVAVYSCLIFGGHLAAYEYLQQLLDAERSSRTAIVADLRDEDSVSCCGNCNENPLRMFTNLTKWLHSRLQPTKVSSV